MSAHASHPSHRAWSTPARELGAGVRVGAFCVHRRRRRDRRRHQLRPALQRRTARPASAATTASIGHAAIGGDPQDKKFAGERTELVIGDRNVDPRVHHHQPRHRQRRRRHPHRRRQLAAGLHARRARLHRRQPLRVLQQRHAGRPRRRSATTSSSAASPACTSSAASARTRSSAWARSSTATCRRS